MLEISVLLSLVDRLIDLVKKRSELDRGLFEDFVDPAFRTFEGVHTDYIESLTRYRDRLADKSFNMDLNHPVFRDIEFDSLKSEHLRVKLSDFKPSDSSPKLRQFLTTIDFYLRGIAASGDRTEFVERIATERQLHLTPSDL